MNRWMTLSDAASLVTVLTLALPPAVAAEDAGHVTVQEDGGTFALSNGIVTATILKPSGDIRSLKYKGTEIFTDQSGHAGGYWSHDTTGGKELVTKVTIDPADNGGERAEVSVKGISGGIKMGHGPGAVRRWRLPSRHRDPLHLGTRRFGRLHLLHLRPSATLRCRHDDRGAVRG